MRKISVLSRLQSCDPSARTRHWASLSPARTLAAPSRPSISQALGVGYTATHAPALAQTAAEAMRVTRESLVEAFKYGLGSVGAFAADVGLLTLLVSGLGVHYVLAAAISFVVGGVVLYLLSVR